MPANRGSVVCYVSAYLNCGIAKAFRRWLYKSCPAAVRTSPPTSVDVRVSIRRLLAYVGFKGSEVERLNERSVWQETEAGPVFRARFVVTSQVYIVQFALSQWLGFT